jgi:transposase
MKIKGFDKLFACKGYTVSYATTDAEIMQVNLVFDKRFNEKCPDCGTVMGQNRAGMSTAMDLPFGIAKNVLIVFELKQCRCKKCGKSLTIRPELVDPYQKATKRLMMLAAAMCQYMPADKVAQYLGVCDTTVTKWNKKVLTEMLGEPNYDNLQLLMVDEKSIGKGHSYVTVVLNGQTGELLHLAEGKKKESLKSFFDKLTIEQKTSIRAVCIDRSGAYSQCIKDNIPQAEIVYDKFHLVMNFNEVVDTVRRSQWNELQQSGEQKQANYVKGQRFNLLRNKQNNTPEQQAQLDQLLRVNAPLSEAYILLDNFKYALSADNASLLHRRLLGWLLVAGQSCRKEIVKFADNLVKVFTQVVNSARFKLNNGRLEGFNNKIARVIHRACGYRDVQYLFLNLRQLTAKPIPL